MRFQSDIEAMSQSLDVIGRFPSKSHFSILTFTLGHEKILMSAFPLFGSKRMIWRTYFGINAYDEIIPLVSFSVRSTVLMHGSTLDGREVRMQKKKKKKKSNSEE